MIHCIQTYHITVYKLLQFIQTILLLHIHDIQTKTFLQNVFKVFCKNTSNIITITYIQTITLLRYTHYTIIYTLLYYPFSKFSKKIMKKPLI